MSDFYQNLEVWNKVYVKEIGTWYKGIVVEITKKYIEVELSNLDNVFIGNYKFNFDGRNIYKSSSKFLMELTENDFKKLCEEKELTEKINDITLKIKKSIEKFQFSKNTLEKKLEVLESLDKYIKTLELN